MRVSIEQAASILDLTPRLLRARIEKHGVLKLLGGPGPAAVALDQVLQYLDTMPPTRTTKPTSVERLARRLAATKSKLATRS